MDPEYKPEQTGTSESLEGRGVQPISGKLDQLRIFGIVCRVELTSPM
jgi:hypothetical protein